MLLQSLHSVFHSLQLFQFKGPATLLSLLCTVYRFLYPPVSSASDRWRGRKANDPSQQPIHSALPHSVPVETYEERVEGRRGEEARLVYLSKKLLPSVHRLGE